MQFHSRSQTLAPLSHSFPPCVHGTAGGLGVSSHRFPHARLVPALEPTCCKQGTEALRHPPGPQDGLRAAATALHRRNPPQPLHCCRSVSGPRAHARPRTTLPPRATAMQGTPLGTVLGHRGLTERVPQLNQRYRPQRLQGEGRRRPDPTSGPGPGPGPGPAAPASPPPRGPRHPLGGGPTPTPAPPGARPEGPPLPRPCLRAAAGHTPSLRSPIRARHPPGPA